MYRSIVATATVLTFVFSVPGEGRGIAAKAGGLEASVLGLPIECAQALEADTVGGLHCLNYSLGGAFADYAARLIEKQGQALFGRHFGFVHRLSWSPFSAGSSRDLDAVIPLKFAAGGGVAETDESALFLQQGVTRWQDNEGFTRTDIRQGIVYRLALPKASADIVGIAAFVQENVEREHRRLTMSLDYAGRFGRGWMQHFVPASGWKLGRAGYEERAIGGTEIGASLGITSTLSMDIALTRWNHENEGAKGLHNRIGIGFRPHPWLSLQAGHEIGVAGEAANVHVQLTIPLGGVPKPAPPWEGLGVLGAASVSSNIWSPVENVEQLQTVERFISPAVKANAGNIAVQFLSAEAATGSSIGVRISIPAPLSEHLRLVLRLVPGSGSNPAVPGQDFVDEPQKATIAQGETSATAYFQLLHNAKLKSNRSLAVAVSLNASS